MEIGVVGHGVVGSAVARAIAKRNPGSVHIYDPFLPGLDSGSMRNEIQRCDLTFLCVPTPQADNGLSCDLSAVEECAGWIESPLCIRSTVPPGTCDRLSAASGRMVGFSPEYLGEQPGHPWHEDLSCGFLIVGGPGALCELVVKAYGLDESAFPIHRTDARTAELCKYMENCYLATKVAFVNQFFDIAVSMAVDFEELRRLWLADPRVGESHTRVTAQRGFGGRCLPKDVSAMVAAMRSCGGAPLLEAVLDYNRELRGRASAAAASGAD